MERGRLFIVDARGKLLRHITQVPAPCFATFDYSEPTCRAPLGRKRPHSLHSCRCGPHGCYASMALVISNALIEGASNMCTTPDRCGSRTAGWASAVPRREAFERCTSRRPRRTAPQRHGTVGWPRSRGPIIITTLPAARVKSLYSMRVTTRRSSRHASRQAPRCASRRSSAGCQIERGAQHVRRPVPASPEAGSSLAQTFTPPARGEAVEDERRYPQDPSRSANQLVGEHLAATQ